MGKLTGQTIATSYDQLLIVDGADGLTAAPQAIESADTGGGVSKLKISTDSTLIDGTSKLDFNTDGSGETIYSSGSNQLDIDATTEIEMTTATLDINATTTDISGTLTVAGATAIDDAVTINNSAADKDFRVAGVGRNNALFVNGANGMVGMNMNAPVHDLTVQRSLNSTTTGPIININNTASSNGDPIMSALRLGRNAGNDVFLINYNGGFLMQINSLDTGATLSSGETMFESSNNSEVGNTMARGYRSFSVSCDDNTITNINLPRRGGFCALGTNRSSNTPGNMAFFWHDAGTTSVNMTSISADSSITINDGIALTTDTKLNLGLIVGTPGQLSINNQLGSTVNVQGSFF